MIISLIFQERGPCASSIASVKKKGNSTNHLGDYGQSNYVIAVQPTQDLSRVLVVVHAKFKKNSSDIFLTMLI